MEFYKNIQAHNNYEKLVRPELGRMLSLLNLDLVYHRAAGDSLFTRDTNNNEKEITDFLGGYGSTILGHNYSPILSSFEQLIASQTSVHSQASLRLKSAELAKLINEVIHSETSETRDFVMTTANSGAEAVEVALKHSLLEWKNKKAQLALQIELLLLKNPKLLQYPQFQTAFKTFTETQPILLSLDRSFHGKTSSALFATSNSDYRKMFDRGPFKVLFLDPLQDANQLQNQFTELDFKIDILQDLKIEFSPYFAFIFEPIQGEGGIHVLPEGFFEAITPLLRARKIPLIADEIQSGLFRAGSFLASTPLNIQPDYILLGKSLGGGVAKASCALIARDHYQDEFGWLHTSTNAEDDWSCTIAIRVIELLMERKREIRQRALYFESFMYRLGEELKMKFPGTIKQIKGKGLFIGLEFNFELDVELPSIVRGFQHSGQATYLFTSYLLHEHGLRVGVTLSAPNTLRFEPSAFISDKALEKLRTGLFDLISLLHQKMIGRLMAHLWLERPSDSHLNRPSRAAAIPKSLSESKATRVGFLSHIINLETLRKMDAALEGVSEADFRRMFKLNLNQTSPFCYHQQEIKGLKGEPIILNVYGLFIPSYQFEEDLRKQTHFTLRKVQEAVDLATDEGCRYFGLGQYSSIVSFNGQLLKNKIPITTGNSLTAGMAVRAIEDVIQKRGTVPNELRIGVVGFTGNICQVVSQLLGDLGSPMTLIHREPFAESPRFQAAVNTLLKNSNVTKESLICTHDIAALKDCDVVLVGTNSSQQFIMSEHLKKNAIILDISVPSNLHNSVKSSKEFISFQGGFVRFPFEQVPEHHWIPAAGTKNWFACMGETLLCGLNKIEHSFSIGNLEKSAILQTLRMADEMGVTLGDLRREL